jgi:hypothetical protein
MIDAETSPARLRDRNMGLLIVGAAFVASLGVSFWARTKATSGAEAPAPPTTSGVIGYPTKVDPVGSLELARSLSVRPQLRGMTITGARSDGTVDVSKPGTGVRYTFTSGRGEGPQPPRPPGTLPKRQHCGRQVVHVRGDGMAAEHDRPDAACIERGDPLPTPRCGPKELWAHAVAKGAPADRLATIDYYRVSAGPAWRFDIPGTPHHYVLYGDCGRELAGAEAVGSPP